MTESTASPPPAPPPPIDWFGPMPGTPDGSPWPRLAAQALAGAVIGVAAFAIGWAVLAIVIWSITALVATVSLASLKAREGLPKLLERFGRAVGTLVAWLTLAPVYLVLFPLIRLADWIGGVDPLQRRGSPRSFWIECPPDKAKRRVFARTFAVEPRRDGRRVITTLVVSAVALLVAAELTLRVAGYGNPVLYAYDAGIGYYPAPNQSVGRSGGQVQINSHGMRSAEHPTAKPAGAFRVLMIGDSTLYGGSYVDQPDLYSARLEAALTALTDTADTADTASGRRAQIWAIGVNAWGPRNKTAFIERFGTFNADLAVVCMPYADVYRWRSLLSEVPYFSQHRPPAFAVEEVLLHLAWRFRQRYRPQQEHTEADCQRGVAEYQRLAQLLAQDGADVAVEILPSRQAALSADQPAWHETNDWRDEYELD